MIQASIVAITEAAEEDHPITAPIKAQAVLKMVLTIVEAQVVVPVPAPTPVTDRLDTPVDRKSHSSVEDTVSIIKKEVISALQTAFLIDLCKLRSASKKELKIAIPASTIRELVMIRPTMPINYVVVLAML
jgi:hypothetical protein